MPEAAATAGNARHARAELAWGRTTTVGQGAQQMLLVPLGNDAALFAHSAHQGTRYLLISQQAATQTYTGTVMELVLERTAGSPIDTIATFVNLYAGNRAHRLVAPQNRSGAVFFYTADYQFVTGRRFRRGTWLQGEARLRFRTRADKGVANRSQGFLEQETATCVDWYDGNSGAYITSTGSCGPSGGDSGGTGGWGPMGPWDPNPTLGSGLGGYGGHGGTSSGTTTTPCAVLTQAGQNTEVVAKMNELKALVTDNKEHGVGIYYDAAGKPQFATVVGVPGAGGIDLPSVSGQFSSFAHTHYTGLLSVFSGADIQALWLLYSGGHMVNVATFTMNLITANGTVYSLSINDKNAFVSFGQNALTDKESYQAFESAYSVIYGIDASKTNAQNELKLLQLLHQLNTGLTLYKGDSNNFSSWQKLSYQNSTNTQTATPCN